jgi:hypothetical protein
MRVINTTVARAMIAKVYFFEDKRFHTLESPDFAEICELPLGREPTSYSVKAKGDLQRLDVGGLTPAICFFIVRPDVLHRKR